MPTAARSASTVRPKISATQISADWEGSSSKPIIHRATMASRSAVAAARSSTSPYVGVNPRVVGCSSRTTASGVKRC